MLRKSLLVGVPLVVLAVLTTLGPSSHLHRVGRSRRRGVIRRSRLILILAGLVLVTPLLAACASGGSSAGASPDLFAGVWRWPDRGSTATLTIEKTSSGYHATLAAGKYWGFSLVRHGNRLTGKLDSAAGPIAVQLTYLPASRHLAWRNGAKAGATPGLWSAVDELERLPSASASPTQL